MLKQQSGRRPNPGKAILRGTILALVIALLCAAILATLVDREAMKMESVGYGIMVSHVLAVFTGARAAWRAAGQNGAVAAGVTGGLYYLALLLINGLFFGGSFTGLAVTLALVMLSAMAALLTAGKGRGRKGRRRYKIPK